MSAAAVLHRCNGFSSVVVVTGHLTDSASRPDPRFPESRVDDVSAAVGVRFEDWGIGPGSLLICGGARGGDLVAASAANARGATVWVLLAHEAERFVETSVSGGAAHWIDDFWHLLARSPSWTLDVDDEVRSTDDVYAHTNAWMLEVATIQAAGDDFRVLAIWDGKGAEGAGGAGDLVGQARRLGAEISVVDPLG